MKANTKFAIVVICLVLLSPVLIAARFLNPEWCGPPAVSICPGCNKRIWEWQDYERRKSGTTDDSVGAVSVSAWVSSLYHVGCPTDGEHRVSIKVGRE